MSFAQCAFVYAFVAEEGSDYEDNNANADSGPGNSGIPSGLDGSTFSFGGGSSGDGGGHDNSWEKNHSVYRVHKKCPLSLTNS